jgi:hypothetical protein
MRRPGPPGWRLGVGLTTPPCTKTFLVANPQMMVAGVEQMILLHLTKYMVQGESEGLRKGG